MKILIYIDSMNPAGGIERVVSKHINFFIKNNHVTILTKDNLDCFFFLPKELKVFSLKINKKLNMNNRFIRIFQVLKQLFIVRKKIKELDIEYDLIYCTHIRNLFELYLSGINLNQIVMTEHGSYFSYNKIYKLLKQFFYPKCKYVVSPTSMDYEVYKRKGYNAIYIPNPVNTSINEISSLKNKIVLNIGRLTDDKRHVLLLKIWKKIVESYNDWKLIIVGKGENKNILEKLICDLGLENNIEMIPPTKNINDIYLKSSIFAFTSKSEGFGMVLAEAMSFGIPCVCFNVPSGPRDIISDNVDGFLIDEGNIEEFIRKIELLMLDENKRFKFGINAKNNINKFDEVSIEKKWKSLLES